MALRGGPTQSIGADPEDTPEKRIAALKAKLGAIPPGAGRPTNQALPPLGRLKRVLSNPYVLVVIVLLGWCASTSPATARATVWWIR